MIDLASAVAADVAAAAAAAAAAGSAGFLIDLVDNDEAGASSGSDVEYIATFASPATKKAARSKKKPIVIDNDDEDGDKSVVTIATKRKRPTSLAEE